MAVSEKHEPPPRVRVPQQMLRCMSSPLRLGSSIVFIRCPAPCHNGLFRRCSPAAIWRKLTAPP